MPVVKETRECEKVLLAASRHFEEKLLPVIQSEFGRHSNNPELLLHSVMHGKRLRPFFCAQAFELAGGSDREAAHHAAAAMELIHCCSLMIDDELDDKEQRPDRELRSVRARFTPEEAIFMGVSLEVLYTYNLLLRASARTPPGRKDAVMRTFAETFSEGVTKEIEKWKCIESRRIPTRDEYWGKHIHSSGGLFFRMSGRIGALLATDDESKVDALSEIGYIFGQVLQAGDDVKDLKSDMAQGYYSLAVVDYAETLGREEREAFEAKLRAGLSAKDVDAVYGSMVDAGSIGRTLDEIARRGGLIKERVSMFPDGEAKSNVEALAGFLASRMKLV